MKISLPKSKKRKASELEESEDKPKIRRRRTRQQIIKVPMDSVDPPVRKVYIPSGEDVNKRKEPVLKVTYFQNVFKLSPKLKFFPHVAFLEKKKEETKNVTVDARIFCKKKTSIATNVVTNVLFCKKKI